MKRIESKRTAIYRDSGFPFKSIEDAAEAFHREEAEPLGADSYIYTRYGNPTVTATEEALAKLERSNWALLTASGMAAIDVALSICQTTTTDGPWLFFSELYGGTLGYIQKVLKERRGVKVEWIEKEPGTESFSLKTLEKKLELGPALLFFEPVTNPLLISVDGKEVLRMAIERKVTTIVDNTFATPHLWRPLEDGADIVVHSATKYLSGHGNLTAGVVAGNSPRLRNAAREYRKLTGNILSPDDAYRLGTQLKTFDLRFAKQSENAYKLACESPLRNHPAVKGVRYPGLTSPGYETHAEACKTFFKGKGFGAMITLDLGTREACDYFVEAVSEHIGYVPTLGDAETILLHVETVFGKDRYPNRGLLRLSVGFEPYEELESTILRALDNIP